MIREHFRKIRSERMMGNTLFKGKHHTEKTKQIMSKNQMGESNSVWKGGRTMAGGGYIYILKRNHPFCDVHGRVKEERLIMEKHLGRFLTKSEIIHHKNKNTSDNRIENLQIVTNSELCKIHWEDRDHTVSEETRRKISQANTGKKHSEETKRKMSDSLKGKLKGRILSEDTKKKISISHTGKHPTKETIIKMKNSAKLGWEKRRKNVKKSIN